MTDSSGQDPRHPPSTYKAKYPYNKVEVTESGHEFHVDDTPGKERLRYAHRTGTYWEISPDGKFTQMTVAHHIEYVKGGYTQTVDKNYDQKVYGSHRTDITGDQHAEVKGTVTQAVDGDHKSIIGGDHVSAVKGDSVHGVTGRMVMKIGQGIQVKGDGTKEMKVDGTGVIQFGKDLLIESLTKLTLKVGGSTITMDSGVITVQASRIDLNP